MGRVCLALLLSSCALCGALLIGLSPANATTSTVRTETIRVAPQPAEGAASGTPATQSPATESPAGQVPASATEPQPAETPADEAQPTEDAPLGEDAQGLDDQPSAQNQLPVPDVKYGTEGLPAPVARMRDQLMDAARTGDIEKMRMVLEGNEMMPTLSLTDIGDPITFLKESSGDGNGQEILAILLDVLEAGWVKVDAGTAQEMYVWPYFARYPFDKLSPQQKVEMYRIVTAGDFAEMESYGAWLFYRVGIGPDGTLHYFVAGE